MPPPPLHGDNIPQFPDVQAKLQKPTRQSAFDKQRAETEAKRQREAQETAAVYQEFVKSFQDDDDGDDKQHPPRTRSAPSRNFLLPPLKSIHGLGLSRGRFGASESASSSVKIPPRSTTRSKTNDPNPRPISKAFMGSDDEDGGEEDSDNGKDYRGDKKDKARYRTMLTRKRAGRSRLISEPSDLVSSTQRMRAEEKAISRPTLRLSNLPPGTSVSRIKALISSRLSVDGVRILAPQPSSATEKISAVAIVTLSQDTPATEIDLVVSTLQHRYLGYGYHLSLHRHLSSAVTSSITPPVAGHPGHILATASAAGNSGGSSSGLSAPFGAKPTTPARGGTHNNQRGRYGPSPSYNYRTDPAASRPQILHVPVHLPSSINQIRLIHCVLEAALKYGPEFEALLMSRPEVQLEEKWAWLWDARSEGGIWYRWRLWEVVTGFDAASGRNRYFPVVEDSNAWKAPDKSLPFQHATSVNELCSDTDYNSDDDADMDDDGPDADTGGSFLNPLGRARLAHLLSRLPTSINRLRKGDIARVTAFAIKNASRGSDEIVDMVVWNVEKPFALAVAVPNRSLKDGGGTAVAAPDDVPAGLDKASSDDVGAACLVGLYTISDILSSSSTSGVRHAWRYRQLFEGALKKRTVFDMLGTMPDRLNWGRLRMEKWKRSIGLVLNLWEGWCVFPADTHELFGLSFDKPTGTRREKEAIEDGSRKGKWKVVDATIGDRAVATTATVFAGPTGPNATGLASNLIEQKSRAMVGRIGDNDSINMPVVSEQGQDGGQDDQQDDEDVDGEPMSDDEDLGGEPMDKEDCPAISLEVASSSTRDDGRRPRKRMRAVDMFAESGLSE